MMKQDIARGKISENEAQPSSKPFYITQNISVKLFLNFCQISVYSLFRYQIDYHATWYNFLALQLYYYDSLICLHIDLRSYQSMDILPAVNENLVVYNSSLLQFSSHLCSHHQLPGFILGILASALSRLDAFTLCSITIMKPLYPLFYINTQPLPQSSGKHYS